MIPNRSQRSSGGVDGLEQPAVGGRKDVHPGVRHHDASSCRCDRTEAAVRPSRRSSVRRLDLARPSVELFSSDDDVGAQGDELRAEPGIDAAAPERRAGPAIDRHHERWERRPDAERADDQCSSREGHRDVQVVLGRCDPVLLDQPAAEGVEDADDDAGDPLPAVVVVRTAHRDSSPADGDVASVVEEIPREPGRYDDVPYELAVSREHAHRVHAKQNEEPARRYHGRRARLSRIVIPPAVVVRRTVEDALQTARLRREDPRLARMSGSGLGEHDDAVTEERREVAVLVESDPALEQRPRGLCADRLRHGRDQAERQRQEVMSSSHRGDLDSKTHTLGAASRRARAPAVVHGHARAPDRSAAPRTRNGDCVPHRSGVLRPGVEVIAMSESPYLMSNAHPDTAARFDGLERILDPISIGHLSRVGVGVGARCLEIGTGGGSIARWLAARVGPEGRVVAVDLDPRWFEHDGSPQLEVRQLDVVTGPIPHGPWDLIHERLVLQHVPERLDVLDELVARLAPGGWLVLEDFDTGEVRSTDRGGPDHELIARMATAFNRLLAERDGANDFAADAWRHLRRRGLVETGASGHVAFSSGGTGFAQVMVANARQVREGLLGLGISADDIDHFLMVLTNADTIIGTSVLITAWGQRPG